MDAQPSNPFNFQSILDNFVKKIQMPRAPTKAEIDEFCRDPDSSGCTLDMLDELAKPHAAVNPKKNYRWSEEIDDAVFKTD